MVEFSVHPTVVMGAKIVANMKGKTGRSVEEWKRLLSDSGPTGERERVAWLKSAHGLGTNYAKILAELADGRGREKCDPEVYLRVAGDYVEGLFEGRRAELRPVYEHLLERGVGLGSDVRVCPCKTFVQLYRRHVFAQIKPGSRSRIDLGLALGSPRASARLVETGGLARGDRITHRLPIAKIEDVDSEVKRWLRIAYELDG
jgi:hypothetical protein